MLAALAVRFGTAIVSNGPNSGLDRALAGIEQAILAEDFESAALQVMSSHCGADKAVAIAYGGANSPGTLLHAPFLTQEELHTYTQHFAPLNPFTDFVSQMRLGTVYPSSARMPLREYRKHPYYGWASKTFGIHEAGAVIRRAGTDAVSVSFARNSRQGSFDTSSVARLQRLMPAFARAHLLRRRLNLTDLRNAHPIGRLLELTDQSYGYFVVDHDGRVLETNDAAEQHLQAGDVVRTASGCLVFCEPRAQVVYISILTSSIERSTVPITAHAREPTHAVVVPIHALDIGVRTRGTARWLVFIPAHTSLRWLGRVDQFANAHGLSATERRVLLQLVLGERLEAAARVLHQRTATTRNMLKSIFRKTGCTRQAELVSLALRHRFPGEF